MIVYDLKQFLAPKKNYPLTEKKPFLFLNTSLMNLETIVFHSIGCSKEKTGKQEGLVGNTLKRSKRNRMLSRKTSLEKSLEKRRHEGWKVGVAASDKKCLASPCVATCGVICIRVDLEMFSF